jgi:hypothetical protein
VELTYFSVDGYVPMMFLYVLILLSFGGGFDCVIGNWRL